MSTLYENERPQRSAPLSSPPLNVAMNWLRKSEDGIAKLIHDILRRRRFSSLLKYDDHMLDDMGLTRSLIKEMSKLPFNENAALIAHAKARTERDKGQPSR